jgi:hypothetical protein
VIAMEAGVPAVGSDGPSPAPRHGRRAGVADEIPSHG